MQSVTIEVDYFAARDVLAAETPAALAALEPQTAQYRPDWRTAPASTWRDMLDAGMRGYVVEPEKAGLVLNSVRVVLPPHGRPSSDLAEYLVAAFASMPIRFARYPLVLCEGSVPLMAENRSTVEALTIAALRGGRPGSICDSRPLADVPLALSLR